MRETEPPVPPPGPAGDVPDVPQAWGSGEWGIVVRPGGTFVLRGEPDGAAAPSPEGPGGGADIVVTGTGMVLASGAGGDIAWQRWRQERPAFQHIEDDWMAQGAAVCAAVPATVRAEALRKLPHRWRPYASNVGAWAVHAVGQALGEAGLLTDREVPEARRGLFHGQAEPAAPALRPLRQALEQACREDGLDLQVLASDGLFHQADDAFEALQGLAHNTPALLGLMHRLRGVCGAFVHEEAAGVAALRQAMQALQLGWCDVAVVVVGSDSSDPFSRADLDDRGLLLAADAPECRLASFDARAAGTVLGEGAVALVLEREASARQRRVRRLARLHRPGGWRGPPSEENESAYRLALAQTGMDWPDEGQAVAVLADGRGIPAWDRRELKLMEQAFAGHRVWVGTPRPVFGVLPSAGLLLDLALGCRVLASGELPAIAGLQGACGSLLDGAQFLRQADFGRVIALQQGFGGFHGAAVLSRVD